MNNTAKTQKVEVKYKIDSIKILDFSIRIPENIHDSIVEAFFEFNTGIQIILNENKITIKFETIVYDLKTRKKCYSNLTMFYCFKVLGMESFQRIKEMVKVPDDLMNTLVDIAYSTTRGIIFEKFAGSRLGKIILPPMDSKVLLPKVKVKNIQVKAVGRKRSNKVKQQ